MSAFTTMTSGVPAKDPVVNHAKKVLAAANGRSQPTQFWVCMVAGCSLACSQKQDIKRHFAQGWHSDANAGTLGDWDDSRHFSVPRTDYLADVGLTAAAAATDAASYATALASRPHHSATNIVADNNHPARDTHWASRVKAWRQVKIAAGLSAAAPAAVPVADPPAGTSTGPSEGPSAGPSALPVPVARASVGPLDNINSNNNNNCVGSARARNREVLRALVAAPPARKWQKRDSWGRGHHFPLKAWCRVENGDEEDEGDEDNENEDVEMGGGEDENVD